VGELAAVLRVAVLPGAQALGLLGARVSVRVERGAQFLEPDAQALPDVPFSERVERDVQFLVLTARALPGARF